MKKSMIEFHDVSFRYKNSDVWNLRDVEFKIDKGERVLIVGPTGCGKTTLCRMINGLIPKFYSGEMKGEVFLDGLNTRYNPISKLAKIAGYVFQNPEDMLISLNVEKEIAFGLENLAYPPQEMRNVVEEMISLLSIEHLRYKSPYELSGGEKQLVAIASVLALKPKVLIMDEPTANLDPKTAKMMLSIVDEICRKMNITLILIEHRLDLVIPYVDRVLLMKDGMVIKDTKISDFLEIENLGDYGVSPPKVAKLFLTLRKVRGELKSYPIPKDVKECVDLLRRIMG
ncbi:MAG: ABC transporter ATP-binding protein [Candidatus Odinarchaeota archaeon]|nr:ABC transporter ATP-binding protein [Candidatus Odinarchaeota archaeon]